LNVSDVSELIEVAIGGKAISQVFIGNRVYDVICRYNEQSRETPEKIGSLLLTSATGAKIPLSQYLSDVMKGNLGCIARQFNVSIAEAELKAAKIFPDPDVSLVYSNNENRTLQMGESVEDAVKILEGRIYSYQHGESGLIDVLNARRTYSELKLNHIEALFEYTAALIELERAAGIWDLTK
jgi:AcrB/AcrD/AcrF family/Outer membrane efflux protein